MVHKKIILLLAVLFVLAPAVMSFNDPVSLECVYDSQPYIKMLERIDWFCYLDSPKETDCISYVRYNNEIIQTNPADAEVDNIGKIDTFKSHNGLVNVYFTKKDLRNDMTVVFGVKCAGLAFERNVTPSYKDPYLVIDRGIWAIDNVGYFMGIFFILLFAVIMLVVIFRR